MYVTLIAVKQYAIQFESLLVMDARREHLYLRQTIIVEAMQANGGLASVQLYDTSSMYVQFQQFVF